jgi:hypothetical protein
MSKNHLNIMPGAPKEGLPVVKRIKYLKAIINGDPHKVAQAIISILIFFERNSYTTYSSQDRRNIDDFVMMVFIVMTGDIKFADMDAKMLISMGHVFSNLVATSNYHVTTPVVKHVLRQQNNYQRLLFLLNARCEVEIEQSKLFDVNPEMASIWFNSFVLGTSNPTRFLHYSYLHHLENMDDRWAPPCPQISALYFTTTYFAPKLDLEVKSRINKACSKVLNVKINNKPDPKSIAIISGKWHRNHAVYKSASPLVEELKGKYKLTLIHLGEHVPEDLMIDGFDNVCNVKFKDGNLAFPPEVKDNDFQLAYFPDIGMLEESIWLSNCRLAPVQAVGYGHPATTGHNNCIDYFVGGDVEKDCGDQYSEQMILLPGLAQHPAWPSYEKKNNWVEKSPVEINCVWGPDKYNVMMLEVLREISRRATTEHEWHFYPSPAINRYGGFVPFSEVISQLLPNSVIHHSLHYAEYMERSEKGDFAVNSFPFGGYNTIVEAFYLGLPVVTLEGDRFYNKAASHLLRQIGMPELTTKDAEKFVDICIEMIDNETYRSEHRIELEGLDLKKIMFSPPDGNFLKAVEYMIADTTERGNPVLIGELNDEAK